MKFKKKKLSSWSLHFKEESFVGEPTNIHEIMNDIHKEKNMYYIAKGNGRNYGDETININHKVIDMRNFNHFLSFKEGMVECEAGVTLNEIINVFLPKGYFLPVTPGTKYITVGGAIANDVHGKNHYNVGSFGNYVIEITLLTSSGEIIICSREQNEDLFWATIGGAGLTGIIIKAKILLIAVETSFLNVTYYKTKNLKETLNVFEEKSKEYDHAVAWMDCLSTGKKLGRGVLMFANYAKETDIKSKTKLQLVSNIKKNIPFQFPSFILNSFTIKVFNECYYRLFKHDTKKIVSYDSFFYPLDSISHWNRIYGKKGFVQHQVLFPKANSEKGLKETLELLSKENQASFLVVLKKMGEKSKGMLSFPQEGYCLALDIPIKNKKTYEILKKLDDVTNTYNGKYYLAKDSRMEDSFFKKMYENEYKEFLDVKEKYDKKMIFSSNLSRRLDI